MSRHHFIQLAVSIAVRVAVYTLEFATVVIGTQLQAVLTKEKQQMWPRADYLHIYVCVHICICVCWSVCPSIHHRSVHVCVYIDVYTCFHNVILSEKHGLYSYKGLIWKLGTPTPELLIHGYITQVLCNICFYP